MPRPPENQCVNLRRHEITHLEVAPEYGQHLRTGLEYIP
jgi:hypothetical protein